MHHMKRLALVLLFSAANPAGAQEPKNVQLAGWFSDQRCAPARLTAANLGPSNPDCSAQCIRNGAAPVFISEAREIFTVKDYAGVIDELGFHVEASGTLDRAAKTFHVTSVKQLSWEGAACARPRKPAAGAVLVGTNRL